MDLGEMVVRSFIRIIERYNMQVSIICENEVILFTDKYILSFLYHSAEFEMIYIEKRETGELFQYNIDSFISCSISEEDRKHIKERLKNSTKTERELEMLAYTLENKWDNLLSGGTEWMKIYQNYMLYVPARDVTSVIEKRYMGRSF